MLSLTFQGSGGVERRKLRFYTYRNTGKGPRKSEETNYWTNQEDENPKTTSLWAGWTVRLFYVSPTYPGR